VDKYCLMWSVVAFCCSVGGGGVGDWRVGVSGVWPVRSLGRASGSATRLCPIYGDGERGEVWERGVTTGGTNAQRFGDVVSAPQKTRAKV